MDFELVIETRPADAIAKLRLLDARGSHLAGSEVELRKQSPAKWEALFDTRRHVRLFAGALRDRRDATPKTEAQILEDIGVFLGQEVLGRDIMARLEGYQHRTLLIRLPATANDVLAAALARVPWEIARTAPGQPSLLQRNVVIRAITGDTSEPPPDAGQPDPLRVLLVFAEAPGSRPLAMREERENLLRLFFDEVLPHRRVEVDVLCHGVTRARLREQITTYGGYHIIHWSGHGHHNLLELHGESSGDKLSGADLVKLIHESGGFIPQFMFLSACLSGTFMSVKNWADFQAAMAGAAPEAEDGHDAKLPEILSTAASAYTGTAVELLSAGVPGVVAMRYEVGDAYARDLAERFYRRLLADEALHPVGKALSLARGEIAREAQASSGYSPVDHATPLILGQGQLAFHPVEETSDQADQRRPQPQPLLPAGSHELDRREIFVGRGGELTQLAGAWLPRDCRAITLVQGLAGMGKTALASEAIHLWHRRFSLVLAFQAKPAPLLLEEFYLVLHTKLVQWSRGYLRRTQKTPNLSVHLPDGGPLSGAPRFEQMRFNLIEALRNENILLVLDNFETNLESVKGAQGYRCKDPEWDQLFRTLAEELPATGSRVLVTSRHRLQALADTQRVVWLPLGPLPISEAALYLQSHDTLRQLYYSDAAGQAIVMRLLQVSRGHPLILDRLASLANDESALAGALDRLQAKDGWQNLPDIFAEVKSATDRQREREYLEDVAITAVDLLIERLSPDARRLLRIVTLANEPVPPAIIHSVWCNLTAVDAAAAAGEHMTKRLLEELYVAGLLAREADHADAPYSFHELVRERMAKRELSSKAESPKHTSEEIGRSYGEMYMSLLELVRSSGRADTMTLAAEMARRALTYFVRARAFDALAAFAGTIISEMREPTIVRVAVEELRAIVEEVPAGTAQWVIRGAYARSLAASGATEESLPHYQRAAAEAEAAEDWLHVAWISRNWAGALRDLGRLTRAKETYLQSIRAIEKAGSSRRAIIGSEVEAFRIDVRQGRAAEVLPQVEARINELREEWRRVLEKSKTEKVFDADGVGGTLITALDVADDANRVLERWDVSLDLLRAIEETKRQMGITRLELARTKFNQYGPLLRLGHLREAQELVESCLAVFREEEAIANQANAISALANIWKDRGDIQQAVALGRQALAIRNMLEDPEARALSHANLSNHLDLLGDAAGMAQHSLAALVYRVATGYTEGALRTLRNISVDIRSAAVQGRRYELPRVQDLVADREFSALASFLQIRGDDIDEIQKVIDKAVEDVRQKVLDALENPEAPRTLRDQ